MLPRNHPDRIQIAFDDPRLVANAGLLLPVTLAQHWPPSGGRQTRFRCDRDGCVVASIGCSLFWGRLCCFKTIIPDSQEHPLATSGHCPDALLRWIRA